MEGFRSLAEGEEVEFEFKDSDKGAEATFVCGVGGTDCKGSERRPVSKKKFRKLRSVASLVSTVLILDSRFWGGGQHISGGGGVNSMHFLMFFLYFGCFSGEFGILGGGNPLGDSWK